VSPILIGFVSALLFGLFSYATYGVEGLAQSHWVGMVFWGLVGGSLLVFVINRRAACWVCRLREHFQALERPCRRFSPSL
jgi:hypothetical protein